MADDVDLWDESRDARKYNGPHSVIAHPPCQRWGKFWAGSPVHIKRTGERKVKGADGGCFESALRSVRKWGGVLEHPWQSHAWKHFGILVPPRMGGWIIADEQGGWTCCIEQGRYGHYARKPTLLYAYGVPDLPSLDWGIGEPRYDPELISRIGLKKVQRLGEVCSKGGGVDSASRIGTPIPFMNLLIEMVRSVPR